MIIFRCLNNYLYASDLGEIIIFIKNNNFTWFNHSGCLCNTFLTLEHKSSVKSLGYICSNSQQYIVWVKIIIFSFMPKIIRTLSKDHVL